MSWAEVRSRGVTIHVCALRSPEQPKSDCVSSSRAFLPSQSATLCWNGMSASLIRVLDYSFKTAWRSTRQV